MTGPEYRAWLDAHGMNHSQAGGLLCVTVRTSQRWEEGSRAIPPLVARVLRAIDDHPKIAEWLQKKFDDVILAKPNMMM